MNALMKKSTNITTTKNFFSLHKVLPEVFKLNAGVSPFPDILASN